jgi:hypothetical protein
VPLSKLSQRNGNAHEPYVFHNPWIPASARMKEEETLRAPAAGRRNRLDALAMVLAHDAIYLIDSHLAMRAVNSWARGGTGSTEVEEFAWQRR